MRFLHFCAFIFMFSPALAKACSLHTMEESYFIGIVKLVEETKDLTTLEIIQAYKGPTEGQIQIKRTPPHLDKFRRLVAIRIPKSAPYYEERIVEFNGKLEIGRCRFTLQQSEQFLDAIAKSKKYLKVEEVCKRSGGRLKFYKDTVNRTNNIYCAYPSQDQGKICQSDEECEGLCTVDLNDEELEHMKIVQEMMKCKGADESRKLAGCFQMDQYETTKFIIRPGQCSAYKNMVGCSYTAGHDFRGQKITAQNCSFEKQWPVGKATP